MAQLRRDVYEAAVRIAHDEGIAPALLLTVIEVETGRGRPFESADTDPSDGLAPTMLFEKHKFLDHLEVLAPEKIPEARRENLVEDSWQGPGSRQYAEQRTSAGRLRTLARARAIHEESAIRSTSLGLFQIMGDHAESLGYANPTALYDALEHGLVEAQIRLGVQFMRRNGLIAYMEARDWRGFARRYNGAGYARNNYHTKLASAFARYDAAFRSGEDIYARPEDTMLRMGAEGPRVEALQRQLNALGYAIRVDGDFGPATRRVVSAFQLDHGLKVDGIVGDQTLKALESAQPLARGAKEFADAKSLKDDGSRIVANADNVKKSVIGTVVGGGGIAVLNELPDLVEKGQEMMSAGNVAQGVVETAGSLVETIIDNPAVLVIGLGALAIIYFVNRVKDARVEDRIEGRTI